LGYAALAASFLVPSQSLALEGFAKVVDGDTLSIDGVTHRLFGIDAPEAGQTCLNEKGRRWPCGKEAITALEALVKGRTVTCDDRGLDDYGRTIAVCRVADADIGARMVDDGHAWAFIKYASDYADIEQGARERRAGVFVAETQTPWDYRAERWEVAAQTAPAECPIKGNISGNGRIYHAPWSPWYDRTAISEKKGERWFCSEGEALEAGWRAPYWGSGG
jgi:endonuclease YncB( thermonuclease family)